MIGNGRPYPGVHMSPSGIVANVGIITGTVADIQNWQDGNTLNIDEIAATPGIDVDILFSDVNNFQRVGLGMYYDGSTTHWIEIRLWDIIAADWKVLWTFTRGLGMNYRYSDVPIPASRFIDNGQVKMNINHPANGNADHDALVDYAALIM